MHKRCQKFQKLLDYEGSKAATLGWHQSNRTFAEKFQHRHLLVIDRDLVAHEGLPQASVRHDAPLPVENGKIPGLTAKRCR